MSLAKCLSSLNKGKPIFSEDEISDLKFRAKGIRTRAILAKKPISEIESERAAVQEVLDYALNEQREISDLIREELGLPKETKTTALPVLENQQKVKEPVEKVAPLNEAEQRAKIIQDREDRAIKFGREKIREETRDNLAGMVLGREFGESVDDYLARNPSLRIKREAYQAWLSGEKPAQAEQPAEAKPTEILARLATKEEKPGGKARQRGWNSIEPREGYETVYKPYGEQGAGYYYVKQSAIFDIQQEQAQYEAGDGDDYEIPAKTTRDLPVAGAELTALRRDAAGIEDPERGITFRITEDGKAIVTGPKGIKVPDRFQKFANEHSLTLVIQRRKAFTGEGSPTYSDGETGYTPAASSTAEKPMPIEYRESGALYFGEMGEHVDRTGKNLFSKSSDQDTQIRRLLDAHSEKGYTREDAVQDYISGKRIDSDGNKYTSGALYSEGVERNQSNNFQTNEANRESTDQLERTLRRHGHEFTITPVQVPVAPTAKGYSDYKTAEKIASIFGKKIVFIRADGSFNINGVMDTSNPEDIFVDVRSEIPAHVVMGHELSHHMEIESPQIYWELFDALSGVMRGQEQYRLARGLNASYTREELTKEMVGDFMGDSFSDKSFWNLVGKENPGLIRRVANVITKWLNKLILRSTVKGYGSEQFVTDAKAAKKALAEAVIKYAADGRGITAADARAIMSQEAKRGLFYSQLRNVVNGLSDKIFQGSAQNVRLHLMNNLGKYGIKRDEIFWTGLEEFLSMDKKVSKADVLGFLDENAVVTKDVVMGDYTDTKIAWTKKSDTEYVDQKNGYRLVYNQVGKYWEVENSANNVVAYNSNLDTAKSQADADFNQSYSPNKAKFPTQVLPGGPLSRDTEILTLTGWKRIDEISVGESVMTRKDEDGALEWNSVEAKPEIFAEKLYHFKNQSIDMMVTADHKMVVKRRRRSSRGIYRTTAKELWGMSECVVPLTGNWSGGSNDKLFGLDAEDVAEFVGWYLSEGSYKQKNGFKNTIQISQSREVNPEKCDRIKALCDRLGFKAKYYGDGFGVGIRAMPKELASLLHAQPTSEGKYIPEFFYGCSKPIVERLIESLVLGDGCTEAPRGNRKLCSVFYSKSKKLADGFQILALLIGKRSTVRKSASGIYFVRLASKQWASVDDAKHAIVDYNDIAYCVTVKNHAIYVRRNGLAAFTGNSNYRELLITLPNNAEAYAKQVAGAAWEKMSKSAQQELIKSGANKGVKFTSSHYPDHPNLIAHVRLNTRDDAQGRVGTHIEEEQSDASIAGSKSGFIGSDAPVVQDIVGDQIQANGQWYHAERIFGKPASEFKIGDKVAALGKSTIPPMPFVTSATGKGSTAHTLLSLKKVILHAIEQGHEFVAWTTGAQQKDRYSLSKQIDSVRVNKDNGKYNIYAEKSGDVLIKKQGLDIGEVAETIGKDLAEKIKADSEYMDGGGTKTYSGLDLDIGGEWADTLYGDENGLDANGKPSLMSQAVKEVARQLGIELKVEPIDVNIMGPNKQGDDYSFANPQPGFTITLELRSKVTSAGMPLFSKQQSTKNIAPPPEKDVGMVRVSGRKIDAGEPLGELLNMFDRNQIVQLYNKDMPELEDYKRTQNQIVADRNKLKENADDFLNELRNLPPNLRDTFANIAHESTIEGVDPSAVYAESDQIKELAKRIAGLEQRKRESGLTQKQEKLLEVSKNLLSGKPGVHAKLKTRFLLMPERARVLFVALKKEYRDSAEMVFDELEKRIKRMGVDEGSKSAAIVELRKEYDRVMNTVYFPLSRFGNNVVIGTKEISGVRVKQVEYYESRRKAKAAATKMSSDGYEVKLTLRKEYSEALAKEQAISDIVSSIKKMRDTKQADAFAFAQFDVLLDDINQAIIQMAPDASYRRHFLHRGNVPGYSSDFIRAYSDSMWKSANHIANLRHSDEIINSIRAMQKRVDNAEGDASALQDVVHHIIKREEVLRNPVSPVAAMVGQAGFLAALASTSNFFVNLTQTPTLSYPWMGARYGYGKASMQLTKALGKQMAAMEKVKSLREIGHAIDMRNGLTGKELEIFTRLHDTGRIDLSQAHDLIDAATHDTAANADSPWQTMMRVGALPQHLSEVFNRQITALATLRLELQKSGDVDAAYEAVLQVIDDTHYDYEKTNRSLMMHGNWQRIVFMFKQYAQKTAFLWGRVAWLAMKGEGVEKGIARKQLAGMVGMQFAMAGVLGLPIFLEAGVVASGVAGYRYGGKLGAYIGAIGAVIVAAVASGFDDDEDDFDTEVRNWLADHVGKDWGEILARGAVRATGIDIASRVNADELFIRKPDPGLEGRDRYTRYIESLGGFVFGYGGNVANGMSLIADGKVERGLEKMIPVKQVRDLMTAARFKTEGATTLSGQNLLKGSEPSEPTNWEAIVKAVGFQPARIAEVYESNASIKNAERILNSQRQDLLDRRWKAKQNKDSETVKSIDEKIKAFNSKHPTHKITGDTKIRSIISHRRVEKESSHGLRLPKKKGDMYDKADYANR